MSNIMNIGLSGLEAAQMGLTVTSENVANASTPGYTREAPVYAEAEGQYTGSGYVGSGVDTTTVQRIYSQFLTTALNNAQSSSSAASAAYQMASQLDNLVGSPTGGISSAISAVFSGFQQVSDDAGSTASRQSALSDAQSLADELNQAGQQYDSMRSSINTQLSDAVTQINSYTQQIAQLNQQIQEASSGGQAPNQLLDERDAAVSSLSQLVGAQVVQSSNGDYNVVLSNGQPLVQGTTAYKLTTGPSSTNPQELTVEYQGSNSSSTPQQLSAASLTGGTLGGLLSFRSNVLDPAEAQLGAIATSFAAQVNAQNELGLTAGGTAGGALFSVGAPLVNGNTGNTGDATLSATLTDPSSPPTDNYSLSFDGTNYTLTDAATGQLVGTEPAASVTAGTPFTIGGFSLTVSGTMNAGDSYTIDPTSGALDSFAVATSDPNAIAAASPVLVSANNDNTGNGTVTEGTVSAGYDIPAGTSLTLTYGAPVAPATTGGSLSGFPAGSVVTVTVPGSNSPGTQYTIAAAPATPPAVSSIPYDPTSGAEITITNPNDSAATPELTGVSFTLTGTPDTGDTFTVASNTSGVSGDGRNALALANLASSTLSNGTTLTDQYSDYVNQIGNSTNELNATSTSQASLVSQLTSQQQSVQGVNLDEEASNLLQYQQLYQANSKVIQTANSMFQDLMSALSS